MDKRPTGPSHPQSRKEKWTSMPASSSRNNTRTALAQDPIQPLDYFHEGERTMSPPPVALEKAIDPSLVSQPDTPAASSTSCLSRTSTLNSFSTTQTQESDTTLYSQGSSSSDETVPVSRSRTFPAMGSYPNDRKILPKEASLRMEVPRSLYKQHTVFPIPIGASVPLDQSSPGRSIKYLAWPHDQGEETQIPSTQTSPSRHLTFPIERPRNPTRLEDTQASISERTPEEEVSEPSPLSDPLPKDVTISSTDMYRDVFRQEMPPDEPESGSLQAQTDVFLKTTSERWMIGLLDSKQAGLQCQLTPNPSFLSQRRKNLHRGRPIPKTRKEPERVVNVSTQHYQADKEGPRSPVGTMLSAASTIATPEATAEPEDTPRCQSQAEDMQDSCSPSPSLPKSPCGQDSRESRSQDSDDDTTFPLGVCSPVDENDEDVEYDHLVESITNVILESSCAGDVEERAVPVELYVHNLLEQIMSHGLAANKSQALSLPIRNLPVQNGEDPGDAGDAAMRARGQGGNGGSSGSGNKKKNKGTSSHIRKRGHEEEDSMGDSSEEDQGNNTQHAKKLKTGKKNRNFSCPFRKRNPIRFNVREHGSCALNSFGDFALLKRHIKTSHQRAKGLISCFRCKDTFTDQAALKYHLTQPESCPLLDSTENEDPEDGITDEVDLALKVRTKEDNIRSWKALWKHLFPDDNLDLIPGPDHEPPIELDEVQHHAYQGDSVREFLHKQTIDINAVITYHGFQYLVDIGQHCRDKLSHKPFKGRNERDQSFVDMVREEIYKWQCASQTQQSHPSVVCDPPHGVAQSFWEPNPDDSLPFVGGFAVLDDQFAYHMMTGHANGFGVGAPQVPAPSLDPSSEDSAQPAAPPYAHTVSPYKDMLAQNDCPCSAAEGSAGRSSGPSSQTHDSGYQTAQEQQHAAALLHQQHQHAGDARPGDHGWGYNLSTSLGDVPSQHVTIPRHSSSDLRGVGTGPFAPECGDAGSNSDDAISPFQ